MPRKQEYWTDGRISKKRSDAIIITPETVRRFAIALCPSIDANYFVGTALKESGFAANEVDTEESGYVSKGLCQIADSEATAVGMKGANLLDPIVNITVMAKLAMKHNNLLVIAGKIKKPDVNAYLGLCHNEGPDAGPKSVRNYGMDWSKYKSRNMTNALVVLHTLQGQNAAATDIAKAEKEVDRVKRISAYGDACIFGHE